MLRGENRLPHTDLNQESGFEGHEMTPNMMRTRADFFVSFEGVFFQDRVAEELL